MTAPQPPSGGEPAAFCYRHPDRETHLRCSRCGRPICNECGVETPVGYRCPDCLYELQSRMHQPGEVLNPLWVQPVQPVLTFVLLGIIVAIFLLEEAAGGSTTPEVLVRFGATFGPLLFAGQYWRLLTAMFVHIGVTHVLFNGFALYSIGREVEGRYGYRRFLAIYFGAGLLGNVVSFAWRGINEFSAGASGAIFGILGAELAFLYFHRHRLGDRGRAARSQILRIILLNIIIGVTIVSINNAAHMGGLVSGFVLGYLLAPRYELARDAKTGYLDSARLARRWWVIVATLAVAIAGTWGVRYAWLNHTEAMLRFTTLPSLTGPARDNESGSMRDLRDLFADPTPTPVSDKGQGTRYKVQGGASEETLYLVPCNLHPLLRNHPSAMV